MMWGLTCAEAAGCDCILSPLQGHYGGHYGKHKGGHYGGHYGKYKGTQRSLGRPAPTGDNFTKALRGKTPCQEGCPYGSPLHGSAARYACLWIPAVSLRAFADARCLCAAVQAMESTSGDHAACTGHLKPAM